MTTASADGHPLVLERTLKAPRANVWRCWTEGALLKQWYCPKPWGVYLDVVPGRRLVFTDAFEQAWIPPGKAFMVGDIALDDTPEGHTRYLARALHWSAADRETHEKMGFHEGWGIAADQLEKLAQSL